MEEICLALEKTILVAERSPQENLREGEFVTRQPGSARDDVMESPITCSESLSKYSWTQSSEDFSEYSENSTNFSSHLDSTSRKLNFDSSSLLVSLLNLDGEDSKWISDAESDLDHFESGFPSPSFRTSWGSETQSCISSVSSLSEAEHGDPHQALSNYHVSESMYLEDVNSDEPLFWPFEWKLDWCSTASLDYFIMSPCRHRLEANTSEPTISTGSVGSTPRNQNVDSKEGAKGRRVLISPVSVASKILERRRRSKNKGVEQNSIMTLASETSSMKPLALQRREEYDDTKPAVAVVSAEQMVDKDIKFLKDDVPALNEEVPIESLVGLDEFDGHEGIDLEFNKDAFSLEEFL